MREILILFSLLLSLVSVSQKTELQIYKNIDGVKFETKIIECHGNEILTFKISNTNDYSVNVFWNEEFWMDGICKQSGESDEHLKELNLSSRESVEGSCNFNESFYIGYKIKRGSQIMNLTHFDLKNITVSRNTDF